MVEKRQISRAEGFQRIYEDALASGRQSMTPHSLNVNCA